MVFVHTAHKKDTCLFRVSLNAKLKFRLVMSTCLKHLFFNTFRYRDRRFCFVCQLSVVEINLISYSIGKKEQNIRVSMIESKNELLTITKKKRGHHLKG
jgi:hypothetical protein